MCDRFQLPCHVGSRTPSSEDNYVPSQSNRPFEVSAELLLCITFGVVVYTVSASGEFCALSSFCVWIFGMAFGAVCGTGTVEK